MNSLLNWQPENLNPQPIGGMSFGSINQTPYLSGIDMFKGMSSSAMQQKSPLAPTTNASQGAIKQKNYIQEAHDAVMDLMKGGQAIPRGMIEPEPGSGKTGGLEMSQYSGVERDIRGNIIGLTGRMQYDPVSGAPTGKIAPDWSAAEKKTEWTGPHSWEAGGNIPMEQKLQQKSSQIQQDKQIQSAMGFDPTTGE